MIRNCSARRALFGSTAMTAAAMAITAPTAHAQEAEAQTETEIEQISSPPPVTQGTIIVTGTRIRTPNLDSPVPVTSITGEEIFATGQVSVGDVLNELPALRSTFSQQNSTQFLGTGGLNLLDLRGLGTNRTLVLVNGRRHVGADVLGDGVAVDVNSIPSDLIERVDLVTGGNSAIYGSDAIAGVVNFILKDDYEGVQLRAQNGISSRGDANNYFISGIAGMNFGEDDRGNVAIAAEYAHQSDFYAPDRPHTRKASGYLTVDTDPAGLENGSDGNPDRIFAEDFRYGWYGLGGTYLYFPYQDPYLFMPDGSLVQQTGENFPIQAYPVPIYLGGNGSNWREGKEFGLMPKLDRYSINLIGKYEFSSAATAFVEAKYTRTDALSNNSGSFFLPATGSPREAFYTTNPYLTDDTRSFIRNTYGDYYDADCNFFYDYDAGAFGDGLPDSDQCGFFFSRTATDLGPRLEDAKRETYRIVAGLRGDIGENWNYEASINYGEHKNRTAILGNVNIQRYLLSIDAVDEGEFNTGTPNGNIVCRSQLDASAGVAYEFAGDADFAAAQLANDIAACQPANLFGEGNVSQAARDYILQDTFATGKITQLVAGGFIAGDSGKWFELPGGPVGIALGVEYRRETILYQQDALTDAGLTFYNQIPTFDPPSFEVKEIYGELRFPILSGVPGAERLEIGVAGRISDYKGSTGTVYAYNGDIQYSPIPDLTLRVNYSRSVRAPNLADLYTPLGTNFALIDDPCSLDFIGEGSENREANCLADGVPAGFDYLYTSSLEYRSGGNTELGEEKSDSWTIGGIFQPRFIPGLALTVDYFDIEVSDVITSPSAQAIIDTCYDASDIDNQFCDQFERAGPENGPRGEQEGRILEGNLRATLLNYANLKVRGIDTNLVYNRPIDAINGSFNGRIAYVRMLQNDTFLDPTDPGRANQQLLELNYPRDSVNVSLDITTGAFTFGYQMRYIGKAVLNEYEDTFSKQGRDPENADYAEDRFYTDVFYHDIRGEFAVDAGFDIYVGVDNVGDRLPPQGLTGTGDGSGIYDLMGRYFYAGVVKRF